MIGDGAEIADAADAVLAELGDFTPDRARWKPWIAEDPPPVTFQRSTANPKLVPIRRELTAQGRIRFVASGPQACSTYASIEHTCPDTCPLKHHGCFAEAGASHLTMGRLNARAKRWDWDPLDVSFAEAELISRAFADGVPQDGARGGRDLRLHVGGEVSCRLGAIALGIEARRWRARGGGAVWTYTHRWREIPRASWGSEGIAVFASAERPEELEEAAARGYPAAITLPVFTNGRDQAEIRPRAFTPEGSSFTVIPCPAETRGRTCVQCRLCLDHDLLGARKAIGFFVHGAQANEANRTILELNDEKE